MTKTILITGSTDGIGLETAKTLAGKGHNVLLHGRSESKLAHAKSELSAITGSNNVESYLADMSDLDSVASFAESVVKDHDALDVVINNAGVYKTNRPITPSGTDVRFVVNTISPYLLTKKLLPLISSSGRVINLSSAAQSPVDLKALSGQTKIANDFEAYAQSKLAITMWSNAMAQSLGNDGPVIIAANPGSLLATKMVKEGFGTAGHDITIVEAGEAWCLKCRNAHQKCVEKAAESKYTVVSDVHLISEFRVRCHRGHCFEAIEQADHLAPGFAKRGIEWCAQCFAHDEAARIQRQKEQQRADEEHARMEQKRLFESCFERVREE